MELVTSQYELGTGMSLDGSASRSRPETVLPLCPAPESEVGPLGSECEMKAGNVLHMFNQGSLGHLCVCHVASMQLSLRTLYRVPLLAKPVLQD